MEYRKLPDTDIQISVLAQGCWSFAGDDYWGPQDDRDSIATVHSALAEGVNFFDTAESYGDGHSESVLGRALEDRRLRRTQIAGKDSRFRRLQLRSTRAKGAHASRRFNLIEDDLAN